MRSVPKKMTGMLICQSTMTLVWFVVVAVVVVVVCNSCVVLLAGGNKDARDMREMEKEQRLREGECSESWKGVAGFEKHTKVKEH